MSAVALLLREAGWEISGSDEGFYPPVSDYLEQAGIAFAHGYKKENIPTDATLIVIGKNAKLVPESNEEVKAAFDSGLPIKSFADILEELSSGKETLVVAGSYGKSTCTALLSWCLMHAGKDPSYFVGEIARGFAAHAHLGQGAAFVLEGDEYPSANWDDRSKFLHYNPRNVLLTAATHDHVNVYPTHEDYLKPFRALMGMLPQDGVLVVNDEPFARKLAEDFAGKKVQYGLHERNEWHAANIAYGLPTTFDLMHQGKKVATLSTTQLGAHNVENIVGISALLLEKHLLTPEELAAGVASFEGVKRRMELLSPRSLVPVLEGFGSSHEKALSAIAAMRLHFPARRLVVVFEPHTFTWRNKAALAQYDTVFDGADRVYIYEPAAQGATTHAQLTQDEIVERVRAAGMDTVAIHSAEDLQTILADTAEQDAILLLTSGELGGLIKSLPPAVEEKFPLN
ncbi:MAG: UDP-N-acetylmuramate--L-alanyl-gamma-D-glutamyl-meso-diaminopimelate ligase [Candidatus Adlerbacteria bacterium]|nr:UDP-N-acetylmuramate--L-alanyl-gamma-D-glutamyl-meso-diaminopimelate ligase [Candidatus Adlerbacteria bacterium]